MNQSLIKNDDVLLDLPAILSNKRIAFIQACWHQDIVDQAKEAFFEEMTQKGVAPSSIDTFKVPGSLEIPLQAKFVARTGRYAIIIAAGFVVDGGIYRHDFVAGTVIDAMMRVQLETEVPILSVVLTPQRYHEHEAHHQFFFKHFRQKGREAAVACAHTLENLASVTGSGNAVEMIAD